MALSNYIGPRAITKAELLIVVVRVPTLPPALMPSPFHVAAPRIRMRIGASKNQGGRLAAQYCGHEATKEKSDDVSTTAPKILTNRYGGDGARAGAFVRRRHTTRTMGLGSHDQPTIEVTA